MRQSRKVQCHSIIDLAQLESEIDVFPWAGNDHCVQMCKHDKIAVGCGQASRKNHDDGIESKSGSVSPSDCFGGFGIAIEENLLYGTSSTCATFNNPSLSKIHEDGSPFEIVNMEVWAMTAATTEEQAHNLEFGKLFFEAKTAQ